MVAQKPKGVALYVAPCLRGGLWPAATRPSAEAPGARPTRPRATTRTATTGQQRAREESITPPLFCVRFLLLARSLDGRHTTGYGARLSPAFPLVFVGSLRLLASNNRETWLETALPHAHDCCRPSSWRTATTERRRQTESARLHCKVLTHNARDTPTPLSTEPGRAACDVTTARWRGAIRSRWRR